GIAGRPDALSRFRPAGTGPAPDARRGQCCCGGVVREGAGTLMTEHSGKKSVLAIGIDPAFADLSAMPGFTADMVRAYLDSQINRIAGFGYDVESCLIDLGDTAEQVVEQALRS